MIIVCARCRFSAKAGFSMFTMFLCPCRIHRLACAFAMLYWSLNPAWGQDTRPLVTLNPVKISEVDTLILNDTVKVRSERVYFLRDTVFQRVHLHITPDSIYTNIVDSTSRIKEVLLIQSDTVFGMNDVVFRELYKYSRRKNIFSGLLRNVILYDPHYRPDSIQSTVTDGRAPFLLYEDKIIRSVDIGVLAPLGYSIKDSSKTPQSLLQKTGNLLHVKSRKWLIRNSLIFKKGDRVNPFMFAESERLLRSNEYIYDARILIKEVEDTDSVDVYVLAQDIFSIGAGASADPRRGRYDAVVRDVNFVGMGQMLFYDIRIGDNYSGGVNHYAAHRINNIARSFAASNLFLNMENARAMYGIHLNRDLVTPTLKWIGGINYTWYRFPYDNRIDILEEHQKDTVSYFRQDYWIGAPIKFFISSSAFDNGERLIFSTRYFKTIHTVAPPLETYSDSSRVFPYDDSDFFLGSATLYRRVSFKDRFVFRFGRTEDIPDGILVSILGGLHRSRRATRPYWGVNSVFSHYNRDIGYMYVNLGLGAFFNQGVVEEGVLNTRALMFTPLVTIGRNKFRQFVGIRYAHGHNMLFGNTVDINNERGLRGFSSAYLLGSRKLILNTETNWFLPYNFLGFRFALLAFADLAWINSERKLMTKNNFYPALGIGIKIRNENLNFDSFQFYLGYYPNSSRIDKGDWALFQRSYSFYTFNDFYYTRPDIISFY